MNADASSSDAPLPPLKIMALVGTRPEIIKLSRVLAELDARFHLILVHSGQNYDYELNEVFFHDLGIRKPDHFLEAARDTAAETIGAVIARTDALIAAERPDAFLILGDTNSCLGVIAAKRRQVPVFHMEAGNRCFDERVPEEINRRIIDHISDINLVYTEHARRYLLAEGLRAETVIKTGSPMREVLDHHRAQIGASDVLARLDLTPQRYFVVSAHREENVDSPERLENFLKILERMASEYDMPVIVSTHPRTRKRLEERGCAADGGGDSRIRFMKPLGFFDYVQLQRHAFCVVSDSGTITEEASILGFRAITIREAHERPEGMDVGTLVMSGLDPDDALRAVRLVTDQFAERGEGFPMADDYAPVDVSAKVARIVLSYTGYVNARTWRKAHKIG